MSQLREAGRIDWVRSGREDHGIPTVSIGIDFESAHQGFGDLVLDEKTKPDFERCLCETFGVTRIDDLVGKPVVALRCFEGWGTLIEGIESPETGRRFVLTEWRRRHWGPDIVKDPLQQAEASTRAHIASLQRSLEDAREKLYMLRGSYHPIPESRS